MGGRGGRKDMLSILLLGIKERDRFLYVDFCDADLSYDTHTQLFGCFLCVCVFLGRHYSLFSKWAGVGYLVYWK